MSYTDKLRRWEGKPVAKENGVDKYAQVASRVKKENVTVDNIAVIMLAQIPGVSTAVSSAILERHKNIPTLIKGLLDNPKLLNDISIMTKTGKTRKIAKTAMDNVYKFLNIGK